MKIITKVKNLLLTSDLQNFIDEKIGTLAKFINSKIPEEIFVEVEKETTHHKNGQIFSCNLNIELPGKKLTAKSNSDDLNRAVLEAKEELEQELKKYKLKKIDAARRPQKKLKKQIAI